MPVKLPNDTKKEDLQKDFFERFMRYDKDAGALFWLPRDRSLFKKENTMKTWNSKFAYKKVGSKLCRKGSDEIARVQFGLALETFSVHRVIALFEGMIEKYGEDLCIDHIDGDPTNNRVSNLRATTQSVNQRNKKLSVGGRKRNVTGVYYHKISGKWQAMIAHEAGRKISLGCYHDKFEAICARKSAEVKLGYTERHGYSNSI